MIEAAIRQELVDDSAVASLVVARVYPQIAAQGAVKPYIVYQRISSDRKRYLLSAVGIYSTRIQIAAYGTTYSQAKTLADKTRLCLDGLRRTTIGSGASTLFVNSIVLDAEYDGFDEPNDGGQLGTHRVIQDFIVWANETVPTH